MVLQVASDTHHTNAKHPSEAVDNRRDQDKFRAGQHRGLFRAINRLEETRTD